MIMAINEEDTLQTTDLKTLWSETLLELLYDAVQYNWSANALREILFELHQKGYKLGRVVRKVDEKLGNEAATRFLERIKK